MLLIILEYIRIKETPEMCAIFLFKWKQLLVAETLATPKIYRQSQEIYF